MRCDSHPVVLFCDLIELCLSDTELPGETCGVQLFCKMGLDVFVDLHRKLLPAQSHHPLHAQTGGHRLHDMGSGGDIVFCDDGLLQTGCLQCILINAVIFA